MPIYRTQSDRSTEHLYRSLRFRFQAAVLALLMTVVVSTLGFVIIEDRGGPLIDRILFAFWDTLNLVSTVGSLHADLTGAERVWALLVIIIGLGAVLYGFSTMQGLLHSGDLRNYYVRRKMKKTLEELNGHIVLCGYGGVGRTVAQQIGKAAGPGPTG